MAGASYYCHPQASYYSHMLAIIHICPTQGVVHQARRRIPTTEREKKMVGAEKSKMVVLSVWCALFAVASGKGTRGNAGEIGGSFLVGSPPSIVTRVGFSLDDDIERDAHAVYGFMCESSALKGEVFQVGRCFDKSKKGDGCGIYYDKDGELKWKFFASATSSSW